jgi:hypothetical protein
MKNGLLARAARRQAYRQAEAPAPHAQLHFEIGKITLHGYAQGDQKRFTDSLQASLAEFARTPGAASQVRPGTSPEEAGRQVAAQIFTKHGGKRRV